MSIDFHKVMLWNTFKEQFLTTLDDAPPYEVDLSFEFKDLSGHVVSYSSGDEIFIHDIKLTQAGQLAFEIPHGATSRYIPLNFADSISHDALGGLEDLVHQCYQKAIDGIEDKEANPVPANINAFLKEMLDGNLKETVNVLNTSAEWVRKTIQEEKDKKNFQQLGEFGLF